MTEQQRIVREREQQRPTRKMLNKVKVGDFLVFNSGRTRQVLEINRYGYHFKKIFKSKWDGYAQYTEYNLSRLIKPYYFKVKESTTQ